MFFALAAHGTCAVGAPMLHKVAKLYWVAALKRANASDGIKPGCRAEKSNAGLRLFLRARDSRAEADRYSFGRD
jgi:hypothetical protein